MRVLSLFDGCAGARQALDNLGIECEYYASEIDKYAIQIALKNYPDIIQLGDIKQLDENNLPSGIDLLIGGSPCQDLSSSKKNRKGLDGEKSGLFWEYIRVLNLVKPKYFVLENVASMKSTDRDKISEIIGVEPIMINSALLTAQTRKRYYWTNVSNISQPDDREILIKDILEDTIFFGLFTDYNNSTNFEKSNTIGASCGVNRSSTFQQVILQNLKIKKVKKGGQKDKVYSINDSEVLDSADQYLRKLTPIECERLQGMKDNYTSGVSNTQRYKMIGNGFTIPVIEHILKQMEVQ
jgi:site-specific DNA-cytosine methylase